MKLAFQKFHGLSNDFIIIDGDAFDFRAFSLEKLIPYLCHRLKGVGADGVIFFTKEKNAPFQMHFYNSDGRRATMCGNGIRSLAMYLHLNEKTDNSHFSIRTDDGDKLCVIEEKNVQVDLGVPKHIFYEPSFQIVENSFPVVGVDTGVPHAVVWVSDIDNIPIDRYASSLRFYPLFGKKGANVTFAEKVSERKIRVRTFERGIEGETAACGTGAAAAFYAGVRHFECYSDLEVETRSKDVLQLSIVETKHGKTLLMRGEAERAFEGLMNISKDFYANRDSKRN